MDNGNLPTRAEARHSKKSTKKYFYKRWWFWTIIFVLLLAGGGLGGMKMTSTGIFSQKTTKVAKKKQAAPKKTVKKKTGLTVNQYNGIYLSETDGLSAATLTKLFGKPSSTSTSTVQNLQTNVDTWTKIADGQLGANLTVNFSNDHAISKSISGVKITRSKKLGLTEYNQINNNDSEDQVTTELGKPNNYSETNISGTTQKDLTYTSGINGETGANFIVNITNGVVSGKSQTGLQ